MRNESILLLALSIYRSENGERVYTFDENGEEFIGAQTNDAPVQCLLRLAQKSGREISKVLYVATKEAVRDEDGKSVDHLEDVVRSASIRYGMSMPQIIAIPYDYKGSNYERMDRHERESGVYANIEGTLLGGSEKASGEDLQYEFYIDYTGGFRDVAFLMTSIMKYLEFKGGICRKVIYANNNDGRIYSLDGTYRLYHLISGVQSFASTGNATEIRRFFKDQSSAGYAVAESMCNFSDAIGICDIKGIDRAIELLNNSMSSFESSDSDDMDSRMLRTLLPYVREKLFLRDEDNKRYKELIEWCRSNHFIQQAITIFVEKMPVILLSNKNIEKLWTCLETGCSMNVDDVKGSIAEGKYADALYSSLYDAFPSEEKVLILKFKNYCKVLANEIPHENAVYDGIKKKIGMLSNAEKDPVLKKAFIRLNSYLIDNYKNGYSRKLDKIYGQEPNQKSLSTFLNSLATDERLIHYFIFDNEESYQKLKDAKKGGENTPYKKTESLKQLKNIANNDMLRGLYEVMKYYLAIKLIRNNLNHASENEDNAALSTAKEYLKSEGITIDAAESGPFCSTEALNRYDSIISRGMRSFDAFADELSRE